MPRATPPPPPPRPQNQQWVSSSSSSKKQPAPPLEKETEVLPAKEADVEITHNQPAHLVISAIDAIRDAVTASATQPAPSRNRDSLIRERDDIDWDIDTFANKVRSQHAHFKESMLQLVQLKGYLSMYPKNGANDGFPKENKKEQEEFNKESSDVLMSLLGEMNTVRREVKTKTRTYFYTSVGDLDASKWSRFLANKIVIDTRNFHTILEETLGNLLPAIIECAPSAELCKKGLFGLSWESIPSSHPLAPLRISTFTSREEVQRNIDAVWTALSGVFNSLVYHLVSGGERLALRAISIEEAVKRSPQAPDAPPAVVGSKRPSSSQDDASRGEPASKKSSFMINQPAVLHRGP
jgi:hypothetical protein